MYKFGKVSAKEYIAATEGIMYGGDNVYDIGEAGDEDFALFFGKCLTLFGDPNNSSDDWENMYSYFIKAVSGNGRVLYLTIYHGSGGSSVAMPVENRGIDIVPYEVARSELLRLIENAEPSDYEWSGIYRDIPERVTYTVTDGTAYAESEACDFEDIL